MKEFSFILSVLILLSVNTWAEDNKADSVAQSIYNICNKRLYLSIENTAIEGNIADVRRERDLRKCLINKIIEISQSYMKKDEINNFKESINKIENDFFSLYKSLIFCSDDVDDNWCNIRPYDDKSLAKLMLEKQITSQIYTILQNTIEAKQGDYVF